MNIALILAGGVDSNFQMAVPKQFVNVYNRPLIVYTMECFQRHPEVDEIAVVCLDGWQEMVKVYANQFNITKFKYIIEGGVDGQASSYNGVMKLSETAKTDDIIIIHDAIRPFVSEDIISDSIRVCRLYGMGVAALCSMDTIMKSSGYNIGIETIDRMNIMRVQTPQSYRMDILKEAHKQANEQSITGLWDTCSMVSRIRKKIYFSKGSDTNLKINTIEDVAMFKALYNINAVKEDSE